MSSFSSQVVGGRNRRISPLAADAQRRHQRIPREVGAQLSVECIRAVALRGTRILQDRQVLFFVDSQHVRNSRPCCPQGLSIATGTTGLCT